MENFRKLGISENLIKVLEEMKFENPSEIQEKAIPLILQGKDLVGTSATGSGKTLAFGASIIENAKKGKGIQALILTPTRELAEQVALALRKFSKNFGLNIKEVYGGVSIVNQIDALKKSEIVVGTPGRILDHLERGTINLQKVATLVLDEADRMLDMGFLPDVEKILSFCPKERQTLLFTATFSQDIDYMTSRYMKKPEYVSVESYVDASKLKQVYYDTPNNVKFSLIVNLLKEEKPGLVMIFCNTRANSDMLARNLKRFKLNAVAIHGGLTQNKRNHILEKFHKGEVFILVCTDVAARGLDIKGVSHVYNYDIPKTSSEYIHRIGRTARAGKEGEAISIVTARDYDNFRKICSDDSLRIEFIPIPQNLEKFSPDFSRRDDDERDSGGRGNNSRRRGNFSGRRDSPRNRDSMRRGRFQSRGNFRRR